MSFKRKMVAGLSAAAIVASGTMSLNVLADPIQPEQPRAEAQYKAEIIERIYGADRYRTSIEISQAGWADGSAEKVIIANGLEFADALAGVPLAYAWDAPILLTPNDSFLNETLEELERLGASEVHILGGKTAVSDEAAEVIEKAGYNVTRIAGDTRYETAAQIAAELTDGKAEKAVVASGQSFADALSIAGIAAQEGIPVLLSLSDRLPEATNVELEKLGVNETIIIGGENVISKDVANELPRPERIRGKDRYETNIALLEAFNVNPENVYVASGKDYADALTGGVLTAKEGAALTLVHDRLPASLATYLEENEPEEVSVFGGQSAVNSSIYEQLQGYVKPEEENFNLTIMHTNDTHANLDEVAKRATAVNNVRAENPEALLLDAGDVFTGTLYFNEFLGQADLEFMNYMEYDAMTFGNHEFDLGSSPEGHQALVDFVKGAMFPFVSSNVDFSKDEKFTGLFSDLLSSDPANGKIYNGIIKEVEGEQVGIFGLTTVDTVGISSPVDIEFEDYLEEAEKAVQAFEDQGVNKIVAITHIGFDDNPAVDNDLELAKQIDGVDVIVGGHSHTVLGEPVIVDTDESGAAKDPTIIVQTGNGNANLGLLDVEFDENGVVVTQTGKLIPVSEQEEDPEAALLLEKYKEQVEEVAQEEIGVTLEEPLTNPRTGDKGSETGESVRKNETILGNVITDGMLQAAKVYDENVIMALQNGGGIRAPIDAGPVTVGEVIAVLPFGNTLAVMDVTGAELKEAFEISVGNYPSENGGFLHVAGGKVEFDASEPAGSRVISLKYETADGSFLEVEDKETYTIATNAFTAKGGDGFTVFEEAYAEGRVTDLGQSDWENFRDQLVRLGSDNIPTEKEGRITVVSEQE